ncbi:MAG: BCAM0308 family protein [Acidobacteriota bacterium]
MRTRKRYIDSFRRRVDHHGGEHRGPRAPTEPRVCPGCGAVYVRRRWSLDSQPLASVSRRRGGTPAVTLTPCPGCRRVRAGAVEGILRVEGGFAAAHAADIRRLLVNEATRAALDNPTARIVTWQPGAGGLVVSTTTPHLAQRLGHALVKAYSGDVRYDFSHENHLARVRWRRP